MRIIDISVPIDRNTPLWPGTLRLRLKSHASMKRGDEANDTNIEMNLHTGTHLDAPLHFLARGAAIERVPLSALIGLAVVVHLPRAKEITRKELEALKFPRGISRVLFKTSNSLLWRTRGSKFSRNYVGLTNDAAQWLVKRGIKLVGVDYLSVASFKETRPVHRTLLKKGVALLEGINLSAVKPGRYQLVCLPLTLVGTEAAPARAILVKR